MSTRKPSSLSAPSPASIRAWQWFKRLARELLAHFLIAGGVLFFAYAWLNHGAYDAKEMESTTKRPQAAPT